jgi:hypothetical protein
VEEQSCCVVVVVSVEGQGSRVMQFGLDAIEGCTVHLLKPGNKASAGAWSSHSTLASNMCWFGGLSSMGPQRIRNGV